MSGEKAQHSKSLHNYLFLNEKILRPGLSGERIGIRSRPMMRKRPWPGIQNRNLLNANCSSILPEKKFCIRKILRDMR